MALAEGLLAHRPLDPADLAQRFVAWYQAAPDDVGSHTRAVLSRVAAGRSWEQAAEAVQRHPESAARQDSRFAASWGSIRREYEKP